MDNPGNPRQSLGPTRLRSDLGKGLVRREPLPADLADTVRLEILEQKNPKPPKQEAWYCYKLYFSLEDALSGNDHFIINSFPIECWRKNPLKIGQKIDFDFKCFRQGCDKKTRKALDAISQKHPEVERKTYQIVGFHVKNIFYIKPVGPPPESSQEKPILKNREELPREGFFRNSYLKEK